MKEDFKKWLCEKAGHKPEHVRGFIKYDAQTLTLYIFLKAMWAINREDKFDIKMDSNKIVVYCRFIVDRRYFHYHKHNNSEQEALEKALEYIYENEK